jgi:hypothetical protein
MTEGFMKAAVWGPRPHPAHAEERRGVVGDSSSPPRSALAAFLPVAEKSMRLFAKEVLPVIQSWQTPHAPAVVERAAAE